MTFAFLKRLLIAVLFPLSLFAEIIPNALYVDGVSLGDVTVDIGPASELTAINYDELEKVLIQFVNQSRLERLKLNLRQDRFVSVKDIQRAGFGVNFEEKELRVLMDIPLEMRTIKDFPIMFQNEKVGKLLDDVSFSGYLNLRGSVSNNESTTSNTYTYVQNPAQGQLDFVQNFHFFTFESSANYREFEKENLYKDQSSIVKDFYDMQSRLRIGDYNMFTNGFQTNLQAAGVQFQKQFSIYPSRGSYNRRSTTINIRTASMMEVFINDNMVLRVRVNPGPYNLKELPLNFGLNKVKVVLKNDFGGIEELDIDMLYDDQILAKGVHDFSYQIGRPSFFVGIERQYVDEYFGSFYHRYGLTNEHTLYVNAQSYRDMANAGLGFGWLTKWGTGLLDLTSYSDSVISYAPASRWRYNSPDFETEWLKQFRLFGSAEFRNKDYKTIGLLGSTISNFSERYDVSFQKQFGFETSVGLGFFKSKGENFGGDELGRRLTFQTGFARDWRFDMSYNWSDANPDLDQVFLTLNWFESEGKSQANISHSTANNQTSIGLTKNRRQNYNDLQIDARMTAQKDRNSGDEAQDAGLSANYYGKKFESRLGLNSFNNSGSMSNSAQLGIGTALVWTTEGFGMSRPVTDSFALVQARGLGKGQYVTIPDGQEKDAVKIRNGESFVFSDLASYIKRPLSLDSTYIGAGARLERESYVITPTYRSGLFVDLNVIRSVTAKGRLVGKTKDQVSFLSGKILDAEGKIFSTGFFTDDAGNFIIDGLQYGKYQIVPTDERIRKIIFEISDDGTVVSNDDPDAGEFDLGTIQIQTE